VVLVKEYFLGQHHPACAKQGGCALFLDRAVGPPRL